MTAAPPRLSRSTRHAMTLLEALLVLGLLVAMAAIAWPALDRPLANQRLRKAADAVRTEWARARIEAMSSGETLAFEYVIEGDLYSIERYATPEYASDSGAASAGGGPSADADAPVSLSGSEPKLPEGITFLSGETTDDARAASVESEVSGGELDSCDPILFYPDGTTSTARLVLTNEHEDCVELSLRGLTGVATVGESYSAEGSGQ